MDDGLYSDTLIGEQSLMLAEFNSEQKIESISFDPSNIYRFVVPSYAGTTERVVELNHESVHENRLIFSALYTANYNLFVLKNGSDCCRATMSSIVPKFVAFLNENTFQGQERAIILKKFEAIRVEKDGVKTQSTGMVNLTRLLKLALSYQPYSNDFLSTSELRYLDLLSKTKAAASDEEEQITLTDYFAFHSWLGRDDIGVGAELYNRIGSPKLLMNSFVITIATALEQINVSKHALINLFKSRKVTVDEFPLLAPKPKASDFDGKNDEEFKKATAGHKVHTLNFKRDFFYKLWTILRFEYSRSFAMAIDSLIFSQCNKQSIEYVKEVFWRLGIIPQQSSRISTKIVTIFKQATDHSFLFTPEFIFELVKYASSDAKAVPVSKGEAYLFSLLLAYQTVPYSDIYRIKSSDFRISKKQNGGVISIDSDYFKARAQAVHETEAVLGSSILCQALFCYLKDKTCDFSRHVTLVKKDDALQSKIGQDSSISVLYNFISRSVVREKIDTLLTKANASPVFIECINLICQKGIKKEAFERKQDNWLLNCETPCEARIFSSEAVKNSKVHSQSDSFDPSRLTNYNSHTNETERKNYLNDKNLEWESNCSRTTRMVMNDIELNVLRPSHSDIAIYNQDFASALLHIKTRAEHTLTRLKVITNKEQGRVDELGLLSKHQYVEGDLPDTVYLLDSPDTVLKLLHYLSQIEMHHHRLLERSPEFLFYNALPTAEWIENVFANRLLSADSVIEGQKLFAKTKEFLPPIFSAHTGGY